jgi:hypothetical protein
VSPDLLTAAFTAVWGWGCAEIGYLISDNGHVRTAATCVQGRHHHYPASGRLDRPHFLQ